MNDQLNALFDQQQQLFSLWSQSWLAAISPSRSVEHALADEITKAAQEFAELGTALLHKLEAGSEPQQLTALFEHFKTHVYKQTHAHLLRQWQLPENLIELFRSPPTPPLDGDSLQSWVTEGNEHLMNYQQALLAFSKEHHQINEQAFQALQTALSKGEHPIESLSELQDLWANCYEQAYTQALLTEPYQQSYSQVTNRFLQLGQYAQQMRNRQLSALGIATSGELAAVARKQHGLRKTVRHMERQKKPDSDQKLINEIKVLKEEIKAIKTTLKELSGHEKPEA